MDRFELLKGLKKTDDMDFIMKHVDSDDFSVVMAICENPNVSEDVLLKIVQKSNVFLVRNAISHGNFPISIAKNILLHEDSDQELKFSAIQHPGIDEDTLLRFVEKFGDYSDSKDSQQTILNAMFCGNSNVTEEVLSNFFEVRKRAGIDDKYYDEHKLEPNDYNDAISVWYGLRDLLKETNSLEILNLAINKKIMIADVAFNKKLTSPMIEEIVEKSFDNAAAMIEIGQHKNSNAESLDKVSKSSEIWARTKVALHKSSSAETLKFLSKDSQAAVRKNVAKNKNTPKSVLEILKNDKSNPVRENAIKNLES